MTDAEIVAAIRAQHLKCNVGFYESHPRWFTLDWKHAFVDGLGGAPYLHVEVGARSAVGESYIGSARGQHGIVICVYPPAHLGKRLIKRCGYRWGHEWRTERGAPKGWPGALSDPHQETH